MFVHSPGAAGCRARLLRGVLLGRTRQPCAHWGGGGGSPSKGPFLCPEALLLFIACTAAPCQTSPNRRSLPGEACKVLSHGSCTHSTHLLRGGGTQEEVPRQRVPRGHACTQRCGCPWVPRCRRAPTCRLSPGDAGGQTGRGRARPPPSR